MLIEDLGFCCVLLIFIINMLRLFLEKIVITITNAENFGRI